MSKVDNKAYKSAEITYKLLKDYPESQGNDTLLYFLYLKNYTNLNEDLKALNWLEFTKKLIASDIYAPSTIVRCRRRVQKKNIELDFDYKKISKKKSFFAKILIAIKKLLRLNTIWYYLAGLVNFLVPIWLFNWLKENPYKPLVIVLLLYTFNAIYTNSSLFPLPCISIFGTDCIIGEAPGERPYRGLY